MRTSGKVAATERSIGKDVQHRLAVPRLARRGCPLRMRNVVAMGSEVKQHAGHTAVNGSRILTSWRRLVQAVIATAAAR